MQRFGASAKRMRAAQTRCFLDLGPLPIRGICDIVMAYNAGLEGVCRVSLRGHTSGVNALAVLPDGKLATGSCDRTVRVWDAASGACLLTLLGHTFAVSGLAALPSGNLASCSDD